jgi:hypothetical protein
VQHGSESSPRVERVRRLIVAIPPESLLAVLRADESQALRNTEDGRHLLDVAKLSTQQTAALTLYSKRRLDIPGPEPVALVDHFEDMYEPETLSQRNGLASAYGLSFLDVAGLWKTDHPTVLSILASDADALRALEDDEACRRVLTELRRFVRFEDRDIDWDYTHYQSHRGERLFVNSVGSWEYRPEVRLTNARGQPLREQVWRRIQNLFLAGDYCRSAIDIVSLEGAVHTGLWAAHALSGMAVAEGRTGVRTVPPPRPPVEWDRAGAEQVLAMLRRWLGVAGARSRRVGAEVRRMARQSAGTLPGHPGRGPAPPGPSINAPTRGGSPMSQALGTYPGFSTPPSPDLTGWLTARHGDRMRRITLKSGASVPVPLLFWEARALTLSGSGDPDAADAILTGQGLRAARDTDGTAQVTIWAPDYAGTAVGPIRAVFATIQVEPRGDCPRRHRGLAHYWWWWYYGNTPVNHEFKRDVWGIPNELGAIEQTYESDLKGVRLLHEGRVALRLELSLTRAGRPRWFVGGAKFDDLDDLDRAPSRLKALSDGAKEYWAKLDDWRQAGRKAGDRPREDPDTAPYRFVSVARRSGDNGENGVELFSVLTQIDHDRRTHVYRPGKETPVGKALELIGFEPRTWRYYASYNGVVEIYDDKGSGEPPKPPDDERAQRLGERVMKALDIEDTD